MPFPAAPVQAALFWGPDSMLMVISPAKTLDYTSPLATQEYSLPRYLEQSGQLIEVLRKLSPNELAELMKLSDKLAGLNVARFT